MSLTSDEVMRFGNELACEILRPQLSRLMESLGYVASTLTAKPLSPQLAAPSPKPVSKDGVALVGPTAAGDCATEQDRLARLREQPSAEAAQRFWRDLRCERLRPQVRLLLESLDLIVDPLAPCRRESEELNRIRTNPDRYEAERLARDMTCNTLKPQAARLLESLAE
jgi:hypothetical protein